MTDQFNTVLQSIDDATVALPRVDHTSDHSDATGATLYDVLRSELKPLAVATLDTLRFVRRWKFRMTFEPPPNFWIAVHWGQGPLLDAQMRPYLNLGICLIPNAADRASQGPLIAGAARLAVS